MTKTGQEHLASLRDGRSIFIDGARVKDVTTHRAFRNVARSVGGLFDFANDASRRELMTFETETGDPSPNQARSAVPPAATNVPSVNES